VEALFVNSPAKVAMNIAAKAVMKAIAQAQNKPLVRG